jgi:predicted aldo/keto reductase-like oxidoreductase
MKYRNFGKLGIRGSAFGLGCMRFNGAASGGSVIDEQKAISLIRRAIDGGVTYLDTAYVYLDKTSEIIVGKALQDGYRDRVTIATKMPQEAVHNREEMEALLAEELEKLQTDHIDFYLMHGIDKEGWEYFKSIGAPQFFDDMKKEGKIRSLGFSCHGEPELLDAFLDRHEGIFDFVQIQLNYLDWTLQNAKKKYDIITRH